MSAQLAPTGAETWRDRLGLDYTPSSYQAAILDFVDGGEGNGMAVAVAGSGKSTTLAAAVRVATQRVRFVLALAFNVEAKDALHAKLEGTGARVKTVHGHGFAALCYSLRNVEVDADKYRKLVDGYIAEFEAAQTLAGDDCSPAEVKAILDDGYPRAAILKLLDLARLDLLDAFADDFGRRLRGLADHHDVDVDPILGQLVTDVVRLAMQWGIEHPRTVDYTDMVWLPTVLRLRPWTADWTFVDEAQDISKAHRALIRASMKRSGRALFVGDPQQAIYGFAGADADSFRAIVREFECRQLPLSVCYRCPTKVLDLARAIVPQIEARPGAAVGVVRDSTVDAFLTEARRGDMVLCRLNAPLMSIAFRLIGAGISAGVRGREDLAKGLVRVVERAAKGRDFYDFGRGLEAWEERETAAVRKRYGSRNEEALHARLEAVADKAECVRVIWSSSGAKSAAELHAAVERLFVADKSRDGKRPTHKVTLSSIHRAKGLEAERVFVANPDRLGVAWPGSREWVAKQEENLKYVCLTRAKIELVFLRDTGVSGTAEMPPKLALAPVAKDEPAALAANDTGRTQLRLVEGTAADDHEDPTPGPLPPPNAAAPEIYDPLDPEARVALARRLDAELRDMGFRPTTVPKGHEAVYDRVSPELMVIRVHSTIEAGEVRGVGQDAIRVSLLRDELEGLVGVGKTKRVNRVGKISDILARVRLRIESLTEQER